MFRVPESAECTWMNRTALAERCIVPSCAPPPNPAGSTASGMPRTGGAVLLTARRSTKRVMCAASPSRVTEWRTSTAMPRSVHPSDASATTACAGSRESSRRWVGHLESFLSIELLSHLPFQCNCEGVEKRRDFCFNSHKGRIACPTRARVERHSCTPPPHCRRRSAIGSSISSRPRGTGVSSSRSLNSIGGSRNRGTPRSCADLKEMHGYNKDGNYQLEVRSRMVHIYCHGMNSRTPQEYVNVDPQENYSIYYEYRTKQTNSCPPESRGHEYYNDQNSGRTHFRKLRLNITDLRIMDNDFKFADSRGLAQKLGSAGDCYNRIGQCPQGDFSINMKDTDFSIRPGTVWRMHGQYSVMKRISEVCQSLNYQKGSLPIYICYSRFQFDTTTQMRRGFCGGYCGGCYIAPDSGLYLDVLWLKPLSSQRETLFDLPTVIGSTSREGPRVKLIRASQHIRVTPAKNYHYGESPLSMVKSILEY